MTSKAQKIAVAVSKEDLEDTRAAIIVEKESEKGWFRRWKWLR